MLGRGEERTLLAELWLLVGIGLVGRMAEARPPVKLVGQVQEHYTLCLMGFHS